MPPQMMKSDPIPSGRGAASRLSHCEGGLTLNEAEQFYWASPAVNFGLTSLHRQLKVDAWHRQPLLCPPSASVSSSTP
jgi:hypothetical protein